MHVTVGMPNAPSELMDSLDATNTTEAVSQANAGEWMNTSDICVSIVISSSLPAFDFDLFRAPGTRW